MNPCLEFLLVKMLPQLCWGGILGFRCSHDVEVPAVDVTLHLLYAGECLIV